MSLSFLVFVFFWGGGFPFLFLSPLSPVASAELDT